MLKFKKMTLVMFIGYRIIRKLDKENVIKPNFSK